MAVEGKRFTSVLQCENKWRDVFWMSKQYINMNQDVIGEKCVLNDSGVPALTNSIKKAG